MESVSSDSAARSKREVAATKVGALSKGQVERSSINRGMELRGARVWSQNWTPARVMLIQC